MSFLRINLSGGQVATDSAPSVYDKLGGRGLTSKMLLEEVDPCCHPLGPANKLVLAPGLLAGTSMSSSGRISIGAKSPLTGGIKESNAGGLTAQSLARMQIRALVIEGEADQPRLLYISPDKVELLDARSYWGLGNYALVERLVDRFGRKISVVSIGPAGEHQFMAAGIAHTDRELNPGRFSARGGLGAVMGAKRLKAIILAPGDSPRPPSHNKDGFQNTLRELTSLIKGHPSTKVYRQFGTPSVVDFTNALNALPTRNFSCGNFSGAQKIGGNFIHDLIASRGGAGKNTHGCMSGCIIQCSNIFPDSGGAPLVSPLEYETLGMLGANCGIDDVDTIARLNRLCNDLGLDTIEVGAALGVAMEGGLLDFGDGQGAEDLVRQIAQPTLAGRLLASGTEITGRVLGVRRIPVVKHQAMAAYEPRALKSMGWTMATSPMGADHTAGSTLRGDYGAATPEAKKRLSENAQVNMAIFDTLGLCIFLSGPLSDKMDLLADLLAHHLGQPVTAADLAALGKEVLVREKEFNRQAGFTRADDILPEPFRAQPLPGSNSVFDLDDNPS